MWVDIFIDFCHLNSPISGTALQKRAYTIAREDEMMHTLFANLSLQALLESRVGISVIAQKTVTNAEIITLDRLCLGKVAAIASLVKRLDPAFECLLQELG